MQTYEAYTAGSLLHERYQKVSNISEGSYGIVTLANDVQNNRQVAVKYITENPNIPKKGSGSKAYSYVLREAQHEIDILKRIGDSHPNIAALYDHFDAYIVLEYCPRGDLYEAIRLHVGPLATSDIIDVMCQLMDGIEYVHSLGIYHRDIKPENVLITQDWTVKLTDWGLATTTKMCTDFDIGSERYMAPELFDPANFEEYDASKVDVWALGVCLLNVVFHKNPFKSASAADKSFVLFSANRDFLFDMFANMSYDLFGVLRHSLTLDPDNRDLGKMRSELLHVEDFTLDHEMDDEHLAVPGPAEVALSPVARFVRHTRQPLAIPSTKPSMGYRPAKGIAIEAPANQYNLQDHFTPQSVFNRYMDKIDRNKETTVGIPNSFVKPVKQPRNWKRRPWNYNRAGAANPSAAASSSYAKDKRREWFPSDTARRNSVTAGNPALYSNSNPSRRNSQCRPASFQPPPQRDHFRRGSLGTGGAGGKYVPPNLRSPVFNAPIEENFQPHHDYELDDEMFMLEDDFTAVTLLPEPEGGFSHPVGLHGPMDDAGFKKTNGVRNIDSNESGSGGPSLVVTPPSNALGNPSPLFNPPTGLLPPRSLVQAIQIAQAIPTVSLSAGRNLYVPPNKRQSYTSGLSNPIMAQLNSYTGAGTPQQALPTIYSEVASPTSNSVPAKATNWFAFLKNWDEYDDEETFTAEPCTEEARVAH